MAGAAIQCKGGWHRGCRCRNCLWNARSIHDPLGPGRQAYHGQFATPIRSVTSYRGTRAGPYKRFRKGYGGHRPKWGRFQKRHGKGSIKYRQGYRSKGQHGVGRLGARSSHFENRYRAREFGRTAAQLFKPVRYNEQTPWRSRFAQAAVGRTGENLADTAHGIYGAATGQNSWSDAGWNALRTIAEGVAYGGAALYAGGGSFFE